MALRPREAGIARFETEKSLNIAIEAPLPVNS